MKKILILLLLFFLLPQPVLAIEYTAPTVPEEAEVYMPENTESFAEGLWHVLSSALDTLDPPLWEAVGICGQLLAITMITALIKDLHGASAKTTELVGALSIAILLLRPSDALIALGIDTVQQMSDYGKLLLPVMTAALAAQGGVTTSAALYAGTALFNTVLSSLISALIVPMQYIYLALTIAQAAMPETILKKMADLVKWCATWSLKILLYIFTGFIGITGVVSGTTDAAAMKVTKMTISGMVPVVGGILADASEAVLVSAGVMKNAAGVYGIFAVAAIFVGPFARIGIHYLMLKLTGAISSIYAPKGITDLISNISSAMGMLLGMTAAVCLMLMISTVCYMQGVG